MAKTKQSVKNKRLSISSIVLLITTLLILVIVILSNINTRNILSDKYDLTKYANQLRRGSQYLTSEVRAYAATGEQEHYDDYWNEVNTVKSRDNAIAEMKRIGLTADEVSRVEEIGNISNGLIPLEEKAMEAVQAGDLDTALSYVYGQEYQSGIDSISDKTEAFITALEDRMSKKVNVYVGFVIFIDVMCYVLLAIVLWTQGRYSRFVRKELIAPLLKIEQQMQSISEGRLNDPFELEADETEMGTLVGAIITTKTALQSMIYSISEVMEKLSQGRLDFCIEEEYAGDFRSIKQSAEQILDRLNNVFNGIQNSSGQVAGGSAQIAQAAQNLAEGMEEQACLIESVLDAMESLDRNIKNSTQKAQDAENLAQDAGRRLEDGSEKVQELGEAIQVIKKCAEEINGITATINSIATQTNMLALNAAIEAARAGEAGKGFAVVAGQVKNLAEECAVAVSDTEELVRKTLDSVDNGIRLADDTTQAMEEAGKLAGESVEFMTQVAAVTKDQAQQTDAVVKSIEEISKVVTSSTASTEEAAASSKEQNIQADDLNRLVGQFRLRKS